MDSHTLKVLEYNEILNLLSEEAGSYIAKEKALSLTPSDDMEEVKTWLEETEEAFSFIEYRADTHRRHKRHKGVSQIAALQGRLDIQQLMDIGQTLAVSQRIWAFSTAEKINTIPCTLWCNI
jgi:DNA mismatch repair protein MutS2